MTSFTKLANVRAALSQIAEDYEDGLLPEMASAVRAVADDGDTLDKFCGLLAMHDTAADAHTALLNPSQDIDNG